MKLAFALRLGPEFQLAAGIQLPSRGEAAGWRAANAARNREHPADRVRSTLEHRPMPRSLPAERRSSLAPRIAGSAIGALPDQLPREPLARYFAGDPVGPRYLDYLA